MASKKAAGPSFLCEWMVGTTISTALGPQKSSNREVIKVQVTTDDETETDSIKITYPRSARVKKATRRNRAKKVRFEAVAEASPVLKKSALKNANTYLATSASEPSDSDVASSDVSIDTSDPDQSLNAQQPITVHAVKVTDSSEASSDISSGADSDPHSICECPECVRGRRKKARKRRHAKLLEIRPLTEEPESETDDSTKVKSGKLKKTRSAQKADTDSDPEPVKKDKQQKTKKKKKSQKDEQKSKEKKAEEKPPEKPKKLKKCGKGAQTQNEGEAEKGTADERKTWPQSNPGPHPRRPHLIEPIRAEVVQTERVIESPQDPPPNAYYDPQHNILRVYHGPVYGAQDNAGLYPKRDSRNRPLPMGAIHPSQNSYYWGFGGMPPPQATNTGPDQRVPSGYWNNACVPPGYATFAQGGPAQGRPPVQTSAPKASSGGSKGAFSDRAGRNNVGPSSVKLDGSPPVNKYYSPQRTSPFAAYNKPTPNISPVPIVWNPHAAGGPGSTQQSSQQHTTAQQENKDPVRKDDDPTTNQVWQSTEQVSGDNWGPNDIALAGDCNNADHNAASSGGWGNNDTNNGYWTQSNEHNEPGDDQGTRWGATADNENNDNSWNDTSNYSGTMGCVNNVMPGGYPTWGADMAADSGGRVDIPGGEVPAETPW